MDWYSWLSKTNLEQLLVYKYGSLFVHNELQEEDITYFNHEFLQSVGIGPAKHRVEILNLVRKEGRNRLNGFSRLILAMNKTKKLLTKNIGKLSFHKYSCRVQVSELPPYRNQPNVKANQQMVISRNVIMSVPIDTQVQDKFMLTSRSKSVSGPIDGKVQGRIMYPNRSPMAAKENLGSFSRSPTVVGPMDKRVQDKFVLNRRRVSVSGPIDCDGQGKVMYPNLSPIITTGLPTNGRPKDNMGLYSRSPTVVEPKDKRVQDKFVLNRRRVSVSGPIDCDGQGKVLYPNVSPITTTGWPTSVRPKDNMGLYSRSPTVDRRGHEKLTKSRSVSVSGPLDGNVQRRIMYPNRSPMATAVWPTEGGSKEEFLGFYSRSPSVCEPINTWGLSPEMNYYSVNMGDENIEPQSLWSMMFQDIKPT